MPVINIQIRRRKASNPLAHIVCGNSDYTVSFNFDEEWSGYDEKVARFIWNGQYVDVAFTGNYCKAPVIKDTTVCTVGVYAGNLRTTTPAMVACEKSILCSGGAPAPNAPARGTAASVEMVSLIWDILQKAVFTENVSRLLEELDLMLSESGGDAPDEGVEQVGSILYIVGGVAVSQSANILEIM